MPTENIPNNHDSSTADIFSIKGSIYQRLPNGSLVGIEFHGVVDKLVGTDEEVAAAILEAEMKGNTGDSRVHLFLE